MFKGELVSKSQRMLEIGSKHHWGIILAGGEGNRLQSYVEKIYGYARPKQYCVLTGSRSLLEHTYDRIRKNFIENNVIVLANEDHLVYTAEERFSYIKNFIYQPCGRDTTAGILYSILKVYKNDSDAIVSIFPSDQFIEQENLFMHYVKDANSFVETNVDTIVLLGVKTNVPEKGCGWIEPSEKIQSKPGRTISRVKKFWEKPNSDLLLELCNKGCLCNTFVMVGKAKTFIERIKQLTPDVYSCLDCAMNYFDSPFEKKIIRSIYPNIPKKNFSWEVLEKITNQLFVMEVCGINWSDWGEEMRVIRDINRLNKRNQKRIYMQRNQASKYYFA